MKPVLVEGICADVGMAGRAQGMLRGLEEGGGNGATQAEIGGCCPDGADGNCCWSQCWVREKSDY